MCRRREPAPFTCPRLLPCCSLDPGPTQVSRNRLGGGFPAVATTNSSFFRMQSFNIGYNNMRWGGWV